jgi:hypothetical protein
MDPAVTGTEMALAGDDARRARDWGDSHLAVARVHIRLALTGVDVRRARERADTDLAPALVGQRVSE